MSKIRTRSLLFTTSLLLSLPVAADGQGLLDRVKDAARKTSVGTKVRKLGAEALMIDATTVNLDSRNLATIPVGVLKLGISAIEIKNGEAVRLNLYLFNATPQAVVVPMPPPDLFVFVDDHGRKLQLIGGLSVKDLPAETSEISVPAMERVAMFLLFEALAPDAKTAILKVGTAGMISAIPVNTAAAGVSSTPGAAPAAGPWKN